VKTTSFHDFETELLYSTNSAPEMNNTELTPRSRLHTVVERSDVIPSAHSDPEVSDPTSSNVPSKIES
jgi:hypothetical protein